MICKFIFRISVLLLLFLVLVNAEKNRQRERARIDRSTSLPFEDKSYMYVYENELRVGNVIPLYCGSPFPSKYPRFLSKEKADQIPFSIDKLPYILKRFDFPQGSEQAKAVKYALETCGVKDHAGALMFCATSLESMVDGVRKNIGNDKKSLQVYSTSPISKWSKKLQNYTIVGNPNEIEGSEVMLGCHLMVYPYAVYMCHRPIGRNSVIEVPLIGEDGTKMNAIITCHFDTLEFDKNHEAFRLLGTQPGDPTCHMLPAYTLAWVPNKVDQGVDKTYAV